jgi:2-furoate---CoA ligase
VRLRNKLARIAASQLNLSASEIRFAEGKIFAAANPDNALSFARLAGTSHWAPGSLPDPEAQAPLSPQILGDNLSTPQAGPEDLSLLFYTSGTTGRPRGMPRRHRAERAAAIAHIAQNLYGIGERTLGVMPLYHTMGVRSLLAMTLLDSVFVCLPRFEAGEAIRLIAREQVTNLYLVPTLYHDLLVDPNFAREKIHSVRKLGFAGAPMAEGLLGG